MRQKGNTNEKIVKSFLHLLKISPIDKIKVKEIVEMAGCSRRSFYNAYADIYDLEKKVRDDFFARFEETIVKEEGRFDDAVVDFLFDNIDLLLAYSSQRNSSEFINALAARYMEIMERLGVENYNSFHYERIVFYITYHINAFFGTINFWDDHPEIITREQLRQFIAELQVDYMKKTPFIERN